MEFYAFKIINKAEANINNDDTFDGGYIISC